MRLLTFIPVLILLQGSSPGTITSHDTVCLNREEKKLYDLMMEYRKSKGLPSIPVSGKLTFVAQTHARDLVANYQFNPENRCNPHSWSNDGAWSACCYTNDHAQAKCMWDKPKEIAGYDGPGYEIAYWTSAAATAEEGLAGWKKSPGHNPLIINEGIWSKADWKAIGIAFYKEYGIVWFGEMPDDTSAETCSGNN
ncbi:MAG TPA: CAP domain-containing protein [Chryseosolibacter sp.]|nr:CAP domain-containing protein [Chryseosolibacter sp.]